VICIEPNPVAVEILLINLRLNSLIDVIDQRYLGIGLAATAGTAALHQVQNNNMGAMRLKLGEGDVRLAAGDDLLETENPSFLKIDVEGMEIDVLQGLQRLIARCKPKIFIEIDNVNRELFNDWREQHGYLIAESYRRYAQNENFLLLPKHIEQS
jgi:FkbM family methyltransferase